MFKGGKEIEIRDMNASKFKEKYVSPLILGY
jgi:hypothetical protein